MQNPIIIRQFKVPKKGYFQIGIPTFWLKKFNVRLIELIEAPNGDLVLRKKDSK